MKVLIIGGVAGGASVAARLRRLDEHSEIIMFEKGEHISYASCGLPYYLSDVINEREKLLVMTPEKFKELLNVDVRVNSEVIEIDRENKEIKVINRVSGEVYKENYDKLVLSPGAKPFIPPIQGIEDEKIFQVRTVNDADEIKNYIKEKSPKKAIVVGGGFIGVEVAENLAELGINTSIIEASNQLLAQLDYEIAAQVNNHINDNGVKLYLNSAVEAFEHIKGKVIAKLNNSKEIEADFAVIAIGVRPESELASKAGLSVGQRGHILVDSNLQTNDENIFALGDAVEVVDFTTRDKTAIPLAGPANKQGRIVADNIVGIKSEYKGTQGTSILKVFNIDVASTGASEKVLINKNITYLKTYTHGFSHANYYPQAMPLMIKLLFSPDNGKIFGAQVIGSDGVDKRIDVIATILRMGGTIEDLVEAELAYAPPYGSAKDPVNIAGMSAQNILNRNTKPVYTEDITKIQSESIFIDVRTLEERMLGHFEEDIHIPIEQLRNRIKEIPTDKNVVLYCTKGLKSYFASRILTQNGFKNVYTLNGGYTLYKQLTYNSQRTLIMNNKPQKIEINHQAQIKIDACGLSCPGPIMKLSQSMKELEEGTVVEIHTTDAGFENDIYAWAENTGNKVLEITKEDKILKAKIQKGLIFELSKNEKKKTFVVFSNDLDKVMASFIIANGAVAQGDSVTMFFTFWGLNVLRKDENIKIKKGVLDKIFGFMMPKGATKLKLSKMNMSGIGTEMMKYVMKSKNVPSLPDLIDKAKESGIKLIACQMAMDVMGIQKEELIDGVEVGGVAKYLNEADKSNANLFI